MILILSDGSEYTTDCVIEWLISFNANFLRICKDDVLNLHEITINNNKIDFEIDVNGKIFKYSEISSFWYRRSFFNFSDSIQPLIPTKNSLKPQIESYIRSEIKTVTDFFHHLLKNKKHLGSIFDNEINKLAVLTKAIEVGFLVPDSFITTNKKAVLKKSFKTKNITKSLSPGAYIYDDSKCYDTLTSRIKLTALNKLKEKFAPSLIQSEINKSYEIRAFVLNQKIFAEAIFSQKSKKTLVDFRNYDPELPNRTIPINLSEATSNKIFKLMDLLNLKTASLDLISSPNGEVFFLEINPVGQFYQVSFPCNYYLEKEIALYLHEN